MNHPHATRDTIVYNGVLCHILKGSRKEGQVQQHGRYYYDTREVARHFLAKIKKALN